MRPEDVYGMKVDNGKPRSEALAARQAQHGLVDPLRSAVTATDNAFMTSVKDNVLFGCDELPPTDQEVKRNDAM